MISIPDTGPGLSGFIANALWHIYRYFPSQGHWDWLILIVGLDITWRILYIPFMVKLFDIDEEEISIAICGIWNFAYLWLSIWFFNTIAGKTFLVQRHLYSWDILNASLGLQIGTGCFILTILLLIWYIMQKLRAKEPDEFTNYLFFFNMLRLFSILIAFSVFHQWTIISLILFSLHTLFVLVAVMFMAILSY